MSHTIINLLLVVGALIALVSAALTLLMVTAMLVNATRARRADRCACRRWPLGLGAQARIVAGAVHERDRCQPIREAV